jgi:hypothetical protein
MMTVTDPHHQQKTPGKKQDSAGWSGAAACSTHAQLFLESSRAIQSPLTTLLYNILIFYYYTGEEAGIMKAGGQRHKALPVVMSSTSPGKDQPGEAGSAGIGTIETELGTGTGRTCEEGCAVLVPTLAAAGPA